jgi:hypothetical protein
MEVKQLSQDDEIAIRKMENHSYALVEDTRESPLQYSYNVDRMNVIS